MGGGGGRGAGGGVHQPREALLGPGLSRENPIAVSVVETPKPSSLPVWKWWLNPVRRRASSWCRGAPVPEQPRSGSRTKESLWVWKRKQCLVEQPLPVRYITRREGSEIKRGGGGGGNMPEVKRGSEGGTRGAKT